MTRFRVTLATVAVAGLLAACGGGSGNTDTVAAGTAPPAASTAESASGGDDRWCDTILSLLTAHADAFKAATGAVVGEQIDTSKFAADVDRGRAALLDAEKAAPAPISADMASLHDYYADTFDAMERMVAGDRAALQSLTAIPAGAQEPLQRVSRYTQDACPGFVNPLLETTR